MNIRVESSSILRSSVTGVGHYTKSLLEALRSVHGVTTDAFTLPVSMPAPNVTIIKGFQRRIYVKLNQFGLAPPFDSKMNVTDLTIFPDFALWPTNNSRLNAVVIHDLTYLKYPEYMRVRKIGPLTIPVTTWYLSAVVRRSTKKADFIITASESVKRQLIESFNLPEDKVIVTEIPPSETFLAQKLVAISKADIIKKYSIPSENYIISVGTIEPRKNQIATLRAYLDLPVELKSKYSLVFAGGKGWSSTTFNQEVSRAQSSGEKIILTGYFDDNDRYALFEYASLFTSASHYEGFGMPILEAMAVGTPTVLSDIPVYREVSDNSSLYVDPEDTATYTDTLNTILTNSPARIKNIEAGLRNAVRYSWSTNVDRILTEASKRLSNFNEISLN